MKRFRIGQVIYVFHPEKNLLNAFRITEESVTRKLEGETVSYKVCHKSPEKVYDLGAVIGQTGLIYESAQEAHAAIIARLKQYVDQTVSKSMEQAREWYGDAAASTKPAGQPIPVQTLPFSTEPEAPQREAGPMQIVLDDGTIANVRV